MAANYDRIANEYYSQLHLTSRNFDAATFARCRQLHFPFPLSGHFLEAGAGNGAAVKYCRVDSSRLVQCDLSRAMLSLQPREQCLGRVQGDAIALPFGSGFAAAIFAFLFDPYNLTAFYAELGRLLGPEGVFVGTLPHITWGSVLRGALKLPIGVTRFICYESPQKNSVELKSLLVDDDELSARLRLAGLTPLLLEDLYLPADITNISPHILIPARELGVSPHRLPILRLIVARRTNA